MQQLEDRTTRYNTTAVTTVYMWSKYIKFHTTTQSLLLDLSLFHVKMHRISAPANPVSGRFLQIWLLQKFQPYLPDLSTSDVNEFWSRQNSTLMLNGDFDGSDATATVCYAASAAANHSLCTTIQVKRKHLWWWLNTRSQFYWSADIFCNWRSSSTCLHAEYSFTSTLQLPSAHKVFKQVSKDICVRADFLQITVTEALRHFRKLIKTIQLSNVNWSCSLK